MDKFSAISAFAEVVEKGSFAAAARSLGLSRSQVNRHVANLEDALGVQLLNRTTRSVSVTPSGDSFYKRSRALLNDLREAELSVQRDGDEPQGEIRLNAPLSFGIRHLSPALLAFMQRYPGISVQLVLNDAFVDPVAEGFDLTLRIAGRRDNPSLIEHEIIEIERALCASPAFLARQGRPGSAQELQNYPCLHYGNLPTGNNWRLENKAEIHDIRVSGILCSNNADVLYEAALAGLGIALLPLFIAGPALSTGQLEAIMQDYQAPRIYLSLVYAPNRHLSNRIRLFVRFIQNWFEVADFKAPLAAVDAQAGTAQAAPPASTGLKTESRL